jgi:hypothetical protein
LPNAITIDGPCHGIVDDADIDYALFIDIDSSHLILRILYDILVSTVIHNLNGLHATCLVDGEGRELHPNHTTNQWNAVLCKFQSSVFE